MLSMLLNSMVQTVNGAAEIVIDQAQAYAFEYLTGYFWGHVYWLVFFLFSFTVLILRARHYRKSAAYHQWCEHSNAGLQPHYILVFAALFCLFVAVAEGHSLLKLYTSPHVIMTEHFHSLQK